MKKLTVSKRLIVSLALVALLALAAAPAGARGYVRGIVVEDDTHVGLSAQEFQQLGAWHAVQGLPGGNIPTENKSVGTGSTDLLAVR